jgi:hypothetical protein
VDVALLPGRRRLVASPPEEPVQEPHGYGTSRNGLGRSLTATTFSSPAS